MRTKKGRTCAALAGLVLAASAASQIPDVRFRLELHLAYETTQDGPTSFRLYDPLGNASTLGLTFFLEPGLRAFASERLQRIPGDPNRDLLDEYYIEDQGIWRVGKQYLPFGSGKILRENVLAARGDTNLILENVPLALAFCSGGPGLQQGVVGRLGGRFGVSGAAGDHFGIATTSLDLIRKPEESPGPYRGWRHALGVDGSRRSGIYTTRAEFVWLRDGNTRLDENLSVFDLSLAIEPRRNRVFTIGWTRQEPDQADFFRVLASVGIRKNLAFEPLIRYKGAKLYDVAIAFRIVL